MEFHGQSALITGAAAPARSSTSPSTAVFQPVPHMAVYGATTAFVLSFTEAPWAEAKSTGVRVLAVCPGATDTPFFDVVGAEEAQRR